MDSKDSEIDPLQDLQGEDFWRLCVQESIPPERVKKYGRVPGSGEWAMRYRMQFLDEDDE